MHPTPKCRTKHRKHHIRSLSVKFQSEKLAEAKERSKSLVDVAKFSTDRVQNIRNRDILPHAIARDHGTCLLNVSPLLQPLVKLRIATYVEQRRSSGGIQGVGPVSLPTNRSSCEYVLVARVSVLPIIPNFINHLHNGQISPFLDETRDRTNRVVKEEHGI